MRTTLALLTLLLATSLAGCGSEDDGTTEAKSGQSGGVVADGSGATAYRSGIPRGADGVVRSYDARTGTAVVTDFHGEDHEVTGEDLADAGFVTLRGSVARPLTMNRGGTSAGRVAELDATEELEHATGIVKFFNAQKGYGFIAREGGSDVFVHYSNILGKGYRTLEEGQEVEFDIGPGRKGDEALNVTAI